MVLPNRLLESGNSQSTNESTITSSSVQANWSSTSGPSQILNKPVILSSFSSDPNTSDLYSSTSLNSLLRTNEILQSLNNNTCHITNGNLTLISNNNSGTIKCQAQTSPILVLQSQDGSAGTKVLRQINTNSKNTNNGIDTITQLRTVKYSDTHSVFEVRPKQSGGNLTSILQIGKASATTGSDVTINGTLQVTEKVTANEGLFMSNITFIDGSKQYKAVLNPTQTQANNDSFLKATAANTWAWSSIPTSSFTTLTDTRANYTNNNNKIVKVDSGGNGIEFGAVCQSDVINHIVHLGNSSSTNCKHWHRFT